MPRKTRPPNADTPRPAAPRRAGKAPVRAKGPRQAKSTGSGESPALKPPAIAKAPAPTPAQDSGSADRIAKVMARAGLCSRRDAEAWIAEGRVSVNGRIITSPALNVSPRDRVVVDGEPLPQRERTRLFLYHKDRGLVTTHRDPEGRPTIFERMPKNLPRLISVGRLDFNTEGLLLMTNDGGLARVLELPATGWLRRYRVRALGSVTQEALNTLRDGVTVDDVKYGAIEATLDRTKGYNSWITFAIREGKNREVRNVLRHLGLEVNRLIRVSFGPFQLGELPLGGVEEVRSRVLRDQLGESIAQEAGADFDAPVVQREAPEESAPESRRERREREHRSREALRPRGERPARAEHGDSGALERKAARPERSGKPEQKSERGKSFGKPADKQKREWRPERGGAPKKFEKKRSFNKDERGGGRAPQDRDAQTRDQRGDGPRPNDRNASSDKRRTAGPRKKARRAMDR